MNSEQLKDMGSKIRLVICDMDGTLLTSEKRLTTRTKQAIRSLRAAGKCFTICTGRIPTMIGSYVKELELTFPIVTANGAVVWDAAAGEPLFEKAIPPDTAQEIMDYGKCHGIDCSALTLGTSYFLPGSVRIERFLQYNRIAESQGIPKMELEYLKNDHQKLRREKIYKLLVYESDSASYEAVGEFLKGFRDITVTCSERGLWDIAAAGVSKGTGLAFVKEYSKLSSGQVCAFGDYDNDISMFEQAGFTVAMNNGCDTIKSKAVFIAPTNDQEGVALTIEQYLLERPD